MIESLDISYDEAVRLYFISGTFNTAAGYYLSHIAKDLVQTCVDVLKETKDHEIEVQYLTKTNNIERLTIEVLFVVFKAFINDIIPSQSYLFPPTISIVIVFLYLFYG